MATKVIPIERFSREATRWTLGSSLLADWLPAQHGDFMAVSFGIAFPAVGVHEAARLDSFFEARR